MYIALTKTKVLETSVTVSSRVGFSLPPGTVREASSITLIATILTMGFSAILLSTLFSLSGTNASLR